MMNSDVLTLSELENFDRKSVGQGSLQKRFLCPRCGLDKPRDTAHRSLAVNTNNGLFVCHRCRIKGKLKEFWEETPKISQRKRTGKKLASHFSLDESSFENVEKIQPKIQQNIETLIEKMEKYQTDFLHSPAEMYLDSRGIATQTAQTAQSGFAENWEHWEKVKDVWNLKGSDQRVVFPILDENEELVAIHARACDENFLNSSKITRGDKSKGVFFTQPDVFSSEIIAITEAPIDALALQMCGIPGIALIGTSSPEWIFPKLSFKSVLIATDADSAGDEIARKLEDELTNHCAKFLRLRPKKDKDWAEVLERIGIIKLQEFLKPFNSNLSDQERFLQVVQLLQTGRLNASKFIGNLIKNFELKNRFLTEYCKCV